MTLSTRACSLALLASIAVGGLSSASACASAPQQKTQAPGYYRFLLGDVEVTVLSDGTVPFDASKLLTNVTPKRLEAALAHAFLAEPVEASVNAFLINTGTKLVLVDTGAGALFGPSLGKLPANLKAAGYRPEQVDEILITHMHGDHVGGLLADGKPAFPNATVRAAQPEADYWLSQSNRKAAPKDMEDGFQNAMNALNPYVAAGRFKPFASDGELVPRVSARIAAGHTTGHTLYVVESQGQKLVLWGDLVHVAAAQFPEPTVTILFEADSPAAARQREAIFADTAANGEWVGGAHLSFPGIGHVRTAAKGYAFVPANYSVPH